jgi:hypothetical protein
MDNWKPLVNYPSYSVSKGGLVKNNKTGTSLTTTLITWYELHTNRILSTILSNQIWLVVQRLNGNGHESIDKTQ